MHKRNENFKKDVEKFQKNQTEILELRNTKTELKDPIQRFNSRLGQAEERTGELEDRF